MDSAFPISADALRAASEFCRAMEVISCADAEVSSTEAACWVAPWANCSLDAETCRDAPETSPELAAMPLAMLLNSRVLRRITTAAIRPTTKQSVDRIATAIRLLRAIAPV